MFLLKSNVTCNQKRNVGEGYPIVAAGDTQRGKGCAGRVSRRAGSGISRYDLEVLL